MIVVQLTVYPINGSFSSHNFRSNCGKHASLQAMCMEYTEAYI